MNCSPFVVAEPSALPEQPEQPEQPALPDPVEDWMTSATAPVDNNDTQVGVTCYFDKIVATASSVKTTNQRAKEWLLGQTKELTTSQVALKKVVIAPQYTWTVVFDEVPHLALTEKVIPALATIVGSNGTVHQLAQEEAKALFLADQEHKQNMKKRADGVADTAGMKQFMEMPGEFHGGGGKAKKRRRIENKMISCVDRAQKVQSAGLRESKPSNSDTEDDNDDQ